MSQQIFFVRLVLLNVDESYHDIAERKNSMRRSNNNRRRIVWNVLAPYAAIREIL